MGLRRIAGWNAMALTMASVLLLSACSNQPGASDVANEKQVKLQEKKQEAAQHARLISEAENARKAKLAKLEAEQKLIPTLLAESDSALRLAQQYRINATKQRDAQRRSDLEQRAAKAQALADQKAAEALTARNAAYIGLDEVRKLDTQIKALTLQKNRAEQVAAATASELSKLKRASTLGSRRSATQPRPNL